ncbi:HD domain-containing protein [Pseudoalteromonas sp.]|uniref:HD domain-containing protein n=1 Tax=Pseudoalteromonas sp. TaxID=53249 RepID=UPI001BCF28D8|nr:HD domain-containing protein [Pseudoalteromonas sp.]
MMNHFALLAKSLRLAAQYHAQQQRKSDGSPYINHLIEVVDMLVNIAHVQDENELCAAALHDSLEDTEITKEQIANEFGICVLEMVQALTDDKSLSLTARRASMLEQLPTKATSVQRIKLADICSNASAIPCGWSRANGVASCLLSVNDFNAEGRVKRVYSSGLMGSGLVFCFLAD